VREKLKLSVRLSVRVLFKHVKKCFMETVRHLSQKKTTINYIEKLEKQIK
jgi:hypothetical protein